MLNTTGLTIDLDQAVPVSKAELDAELDACLSKYQEDDNAPLSPALRTIAHKLAKKRGKTPAYKGINFGLVLQTHLPISQARADIKALSALTQTCKKKSVYAHAMYTIPGEFHKQWFRCRVVRKVRHGYLIQWLDGDKKDTFKLPQHIRME
jgi:TPP-dependent trihydroxycyclohexane-1,2-dione (THcHDO) dehydratase